MKMLNMKKIAKLLLISFAVIFLLILCIIIFYTIPPYGKMPDAMKNKMIELSNENPNDVEFAKEVTIFIVERWKSPVREYIRQPFKPFIKTYNKAWEVPMNEYQSSNVEARLIKRMLLESKRFTKKEIRYMHGFCTISPHGYLEIEKAGKNKTEKFYLDTWALEYGACMGQFASVGCEIPSSFKGNCI